MEFPHFPCIEIATIKTESVESPLLENFLQDFNAQLVEDISHLEASCEKLRDCKKGLQTFKDKYVREIYALTHNIKGDEILPQQLSSRIQSELGQFRVSEHRIEEMLSHFNGDYKDWRSSLDQQMQTSLGTDDLIDLTQEELMDKLGAMRTTAENAKTELNTIEEIAKKNTTILEVELRALQEEVNKLDTLKKEMSNTQEQLMDELKEKQFKNQQDTNKLLREIASLQKNIELYN
ncbi:uncharacterized protein LOC105665236 [Ceratitis capitata]|nr:uncharacterized protein LOC105665236 [Ceratitis capitata]